MLKKIITLALLAVLFLSWHEPTSAKTFTTDPIKDSTKPWTITFNEAVSKADLKLIVIKVKGKANHPVDSPTISADSKKVIVQPSIPYEPGIAYTLVVPKGFKSSKGEVLQADVTMAFTLSSTHIESIEANWNAFATNVVVKTSNHVGKITISVYEGDEKTFMRLGNEFSRGMSNLTKGTQLTIRAYDERGILLETKTYKVK